MSEVQGDIVYHQVLASDELGGAGQVALRIGQRLQQRGLQCVVWAPGPGPAYDAARELGLDVRLFNARDGFAAQKVRAIRANWQFARQLKQFRRSVIHVHSPYTYGAFCASIKFTGIPCVAHVQIHEDAEGLKWAFRRMPEVIIACASYLADHVLTHCGVSVMQADRVVGLPNPVDTLRFRPGDKSLEKKRLGVPPESTLAVMLANLAPHKGQATAIRAVGKLLKRGTRIHLWIAGVERGGANAYTAYLNSLAADEGVAEMVRLLGHRSDTPELLRAADLFLLPSTHEGLPLSVLEAQATGVPVLAAPTAGIPEVIADGRTGYLIDADDVQEYADRIEWLLQNPSIADRTADAAFQQCVHGYNWDRYFEQVLSVYHNAILFRRERLGLRGLRARFIRN